jgi:hypothetical protein
MPEDEYILHRKKRHTRREFECQCGASFYTQKKLELHRKQVHTGPWYRCGRCLVVCKTWKAFKRHAEGPVCKTQNPLYTEPRPGHRKRSGDVPEPEQVAVDGTESDSGPDSKSVSET